MRARLLISITVSLSLSLSHMPTHTNTHFTEHSREPSVTTLSSLALNERPDVIIQPVRCQVLGLTDLFFITEI